MIVPLLLLFNYLIKPIFHNNTKNNKKIIKLDIKVISNNYKGTFIFEKIYRNIYINKTPVDSYGIPIPTYNGMVNYYLIKLNEKKIINIYCRAMNNVRIFCSFQITKHAIMNRIIEGFTYSDKLHKKYDIPRLHRELEQYLDGKINKITYKPKKIRRRYIRYQI